MNPTDSDESRNSSSASDSESDGEKQQNHRQRSASVSASSRSRSNSSSSDSDEEKQNVTKPKSVSSGDSRSSRSRSSSFETKTNKSSHNSTPLHSESRSPSPGPTKSPTFVPVSKSSGSKSPASRSVSKSPVSRPASVESKSPNFTKSQPTESSCNSPDRRSVTNKSPSGNSSRIRSPVIREGPPRSPSAASSRSNSPLVNHNNLDNAIDSPMNGRSKSVSPDRGSNSSKSDSSRTSKVIHEAANLDDGNTSDSSDSSEDDISRHRKRTLQKDDTRPEDISDDVDSEIERKEREEKEKERDAIQKESVANLQMAHEDLSDVSDLDGPSEDEESRRSNESGSKINEIINETDIKKIAENNVRTDEGEEQLDFEAEDGECAEQESPKEKEETKTASVGIENQEAGEIKEVEETVEEKDLEEGELTDEDEARPEETEPRPVCRFFSRGQCTWGASCRFLHPGVTDKGNYTMFELIRPVVPGEFGHERMFYGRPEPPPMESAWERGLRTAKEMLRKSMKRKEQDIDFEEKKMNLSLTQEELDKENGYYTTGPSPEPRYAPARHVVPADYGPPTPAVRPQTEEYFSRRHVIYEPDYVQPPPRERARPYREVPVHRVPDYYTAKYEEDAASSAKLRKPKREVIVQRVEEERRPGRGDEWSDPWMRSKSPAGRKGRRRSYSSGSSYSSSSSSGSSRSSYRSRSSRRRHTSLRRHKRQVSPSVIVSERKAANERAALMNPPAPRKKAPSPGMMRAGAQNPPAPSMKVDQFGRTRSKLAVAAALARVKGRTRSSRSRSSSGSSSGSSSSDSDSSGSSSSSSRERSPPRRPTGVDLAMALKAKAIDALKSGNEKRQIKLNLKAVPVTTKKPDLSNLAIHQQGKKRPLPLNSPPSSSALDVSSKASNKKASSRREELLKQLKAVEDAIAKKRSKVN